MPSETTSIGLNTSAFEQPLERLIGRMAAYNASAIQSTSQSQQFGKMLKSAGEATASAASVIAQSAKAMTLAFEGPSAAFTKRFKDVEAELQKLAPMLKDLGKQAKDVDILPKNLDKLGVEAARNVKQMGNALITEYKRVSTELAKPIQIKVEGPKGGTAGGVDLAALKQQYQKQINEVQQVLQGAITGPMAKGAFGAQQKDQITFALKELTDAWVTSAPSVTRVKQALQNALQGGFLPKAETDKYIKQIHQFGVDVYAAMQRATTLEQQAADEHAAKKQQQKIQGKQLFAYNEILRLAPPDYAAMSVRERAAMDKMIEELTAAYAKSGMQLKQFRQAFLDIVVGGKVLTATERKDSLAVLMEQMGAQMTAATVKRIAIDEKNAADLKAANAKVASTLAADRAATRTAEIAPVVAKYFPNAAEFANLSQLQRSALEKAVKDLKQAYADGTMTLQAVEEKFYRAVKGGEIVPMGADRNATIVAMEQVATQVRAAYKKYSDSLDKAAVNERTRAAERRAAGAVPYLQKIIQPDLFSPADYAKLQAQIQKIAELYGADRAMSLKTLVTRFWQAISSTPQNIPVEQRTGPVMTAMLKFGEDYQTKLQSVTAQINASSEEAALKRRIAFAKTMEVTNTAWVKAGVMTPIKASGMLPALLPNDFIQSFLQSFAVLQQALTASGRTLQTVKTQWDAAFQGGLIPVGTKDAAIKEIYKLADEYNTAIKKLVQTQKDAQNQQAATSILRTAFSSFTQGLPADERAKIEKQFGAIADALNFEKSKVIKSFKDFYIAIQTAIQDQQKFSATALADPVVRALVATSTAIKAQAENTTAEQAIKAMMVRVRTQLEAGSTVVGTRLTDLFAGSGQASAKVFGIAFANMIKEVEKAKIPIDTFLAQLERVIAGNNAAANSFGTALKDSIATFIGAIVTAEQSAKRAGQNIKSTLEAQYTQQVAARLPRALGINMADLNPQQINMVNAVVQQAAQSFAKYNAQLFATGNTVKVTEKHLQDLVAAYERVRQGVVSTQGPLTQEENIMVGLVAGIKKAEKALDDTTRSWVRFSQLVFARALTQTFYWVTQSMRTAATAALDVSVAIGEIQTISHSAPMTIERWASSIAMLSDKYNTAQKDIAEALYQTESNQIAIGQRAVDFLDKAGMFAKATVSTVSESVNLLSSTLNAFKIPITETEVVAAELFKTIELGRVRARDMGDTLGRSAVLAHQAGIGLEEYLTMIQTFTISGIRFDQTSTFMINVINKLMKPSKEMKELFHEWGVESGSAAIQMFGLQGVVQRLFQSTAGDLGELADYIKDIRGTTGFAGLMSSLDLVNVNMKKTFGGMKDYIQAQKEVMASTGMVIRGEMNQIKNAFIEQMTGIMDLLANTNKGLKEHGTSLSTVFKTFLPAVEIVAGIGFFTTLGTVSGLLTARYMALFRSIALVAGGMTLGYQAVKTFREGFSSLAGVLDLTKQRIEPVVTSLKELTGTMRMDVSQLEQKRIQEMAGAQRAESIIQEDRLESRRTFLKDMMQSHQKELEDQRDVLREQLNDLKRAAKSSEDWVADFRRKFRTKTIEESKFGRSPMEILNIDLAKAGETLDQAFAKMGTATTGTQLENAREDFQAWVDEMGKAKETLQKEMGIRDIPGLDIFRQDQVDKFLSLYQQRAQELQQTAIPALQAQLSTLEKDIKNYNELTQAVEKHVADATMAQGNFLEKIEKTNGQWARMLELLPQITAALGDVQTEARTLDALQIAQTKQRTAVQQSEERARVATFTTFAGQIDSFLANTSLVSKALEGAGQSSAIPAQQATLERMLNETVFALKGNGTGPEGVMTPEETMSVLKDRQQGLFDAVTTLARTTRTEAIASDLYNKNKEVFEAIRLNTEGLAPLTEQQGYLTAGTFEKAIMSEQMRAAQAQSVSSGLDNFTKAGGYINVKAMETKNPALPSVVPTTNFQDQFANAIPNFNATLPKQYHQGGIVPYYMGQGGNVPAYLQAGELVVDRGTTNKLLKYLAEGGYSENDSYYWKRRREAGLLDSASSENDGYHQRLLSQAGLNRGDLSENEAYYLKRNQGTGVSDATLLERWGSPLTWSFRDSDRIERAKQNEREARQIDRVRHPENYPQFTAEDFLRAMFGGKEAPVDRSRQKPVNFAGLAPESAEYRKAVNQAITQEAMASIKLKPQDPGYVQAVNQRIAVLTKYFGSPETSRDLSSLKPGSFEYALEVDRINKNTEVSLKKIQDAKTPESIRAISAKLEQQKTQLSTISYDESQARVPGLLNALGFGKSKKGDLAKYLWDPTSNSWYGRALTPGGIAAGTGALLGAIATGGALAPALGTASGVAATGAAGASTGASSEFLLATTLARAMGTGALPSLTTEIVGGTATQASKYVTLRLLKTISGPILKQLIKRKGFLIGLGGAIGAGAAWNWAQAMLQDTSNAQHKATGGAIGFPGTPRGTDTVPAWLTPGEFVVNASAAAQHRDILERINSFATSTRPNYTYATQYKENGGAVGSTNVHYNNNVTINNPTGNPVMDAQRIIREINRQQFRGTAEIRR